jgi:hypothetical protein
MSVKGYLWWDARPGIRLWQLLAERQQTSTGTRAYVAMQKNSNEADYAADQKHPAEEYLHIKSRHNWLGHGNKAERRYYQALEQEQYPVTPDRFLNLLRCKVFCLWIFRRQSSTQLHALPQMWRNTPPQQDPITQPHDCEKS